MHPRDLERWLAFLIASHRADWPLTPHQLGRWFTEEDGWPDDSVNTLMLEYEFAHELLKAYEKNRGPS